MRLLHEVDATLHFLEDGAGDAGRERSVVVVLHGAGGTTGGDGTEGGYVAEHFGEGHLSLDDARTAAAALHTFDLTTTLVEVANHVTHVFLGGYDLELHDGLHEHGTGLCAGVLVGLEGCDLERELVGVNGVE